MSDDANARHRDRLLELYRPLIDPTRPVALVDFQDTKNCGDHAIWLGQRLLLRRLGVEVVYECSHETYDKAAMAAALGSGTVLISGGGSFGDLYPDYMLFKLAVIEDFPDNEIILFPQTAMFFTTTVLEQTVAAIARHGKVTVTSRDVLTHRTLTRALGDKARMVQAPDMACMIEGLRRDVRPYFDVVWISRDDGESNGGSRPLTASGLDLLPRRFHLGAFDDPIKIEALGKIGGRRLFATDWYRMMVDEQSLETDYAALTLEARSAVWVARAVRLLSYGKLVITDRLHGHILCTLAGIPHILLNNSYGKNYAYFETWSRPSPLCRLAASPERAWAKALAMLGEPQPARDGSPQIYA
ncbi:MAG TPA: polysaccharide pyruvyl transferase family protein [Caulobacteraceae bacterium]|jgi:pyruvyl transferase EpsO|nr:polysaccharide pyruvyl transferase family protein [Caulobacteraceae bacterium]